MQKGQTGILILVGILVLVGVLGGVYFLGKSSKVEPAKVVSTTQPTPSPTTSSQASASGEMANWKTYTNNSYKFLYPTEWFLREDNGAQLFYSNQQDAGKGAPTFIMIVTSYDKELLTGAYKITFEDPVGTRKETADKVFTTKIKKLTIDGHNAFEAKSEVLPGSQTDAKSGIGVYIEMNKQVLDISMVAFQNSSDSDTKIFEQVLSTFKFTQ